MMPSVLSLLLVLLLWAGSALAVPETVSLRVTDLTTSSFAVVWMTDVAATPALEVYGDAAMVKRLSDSVTVTPMPDAAPEVAAAARSKGVMKVRVAGLTPNTTYYVRTLTADPADPLSIGYSGLQQVSTAAAVLPYRPAADGTLQGIGNDLISFKVYIRPHDTDAVPGQGDLILLETPGAANPVSAFVGVGVAAPEGVLDLNNLFGTDLTSLALLGGEKTILSVYRGGALSTLQHYRKLPANSNVVSVAAPLQGFYADLNLDGKVDDQDFAAFRSQYRTAADDTAFNPDFKFICNQPVSVGAQDFARFAKEYGRSGVQCSTPQECGTLTCP
jgi:hypothetical protein